MTLSAKEIDSSINRILKVGPVDTGLFVLAIHSLIEHTLSVKYNAVDDSDFSVLLSAYISDYKNAHGKPLSLNSDKYHFNSKQETDIFLQLTKIFENHKLANGVRHQFYQLNEEEAKSSVACFIAFAKAENWSGSTALLKLENQLEDWKKHGDYQSDELKEAIEQIKKLREQNTNLTRQANEYNELKSQLEVVSAKQAASESQLRDVTLRLSKKDQKLDAVRKQAREESEKNRKEKQDILKKLEDYEETRKYVSYLERISFYTRTRHDYEKSIISLTNEQKQVISQLNVNKDYLVKGAAGTGKSLVLIKALEKALETLHGELGLEQSSAREFRLLTYTKSLVKYNRYVAQLMETSVPPDSIITANAFIYEAMNHYFPGKTIVYKMSPDSLGSIFRSDVFKPEEILKEAEEFYWANRMTEELYVVQNVKREGMKKQLQKKDRVEMYSAISDAENRLLQEKYWPLNFAAARLIEAVENDSSPDNKLFAEYSFVDEAQDLPPVILALIKATTKRSVFLAGDSDQSIYRKGFSWNKSGIDISGRTRILRTNFRNTIQIHEYAEEYRSSFKTRDLETEPKAFRPGPPVEHFKAKTTDELKDQMVQQVKLLLDSLHYEPENLCILANEQGKLLKIKTQIENQLETECALIHDDSFDFSNTPGVRLCTMQSCKGLDFPVVLVFADHRCHALQNSSAYDEETFIQQQKNMVYVSLTRAMEMLFVYTVEGSSFEPFNLLK